MARRGSSIYLSIVLAKIWLLKGSTVTIKRNVPNPLVAKRHHKIEIVRKVCEIVTLQDSKFCGKGLGRQEDYQTNDKDIESYEHYRSTPICGN